jgi:hypothetical protein
MNHFKIMFRNGVMFDLATPEDANTVLDSAAKMMKQGTILIFTGNVVLRWSEVVCVWKVEELK